MSDKQASRRLSNEGKVCDAVVKVLEQRTGETRADIRRPEKDCSGPPVELRLKLGAQEYAIEHTQIEAFEGQIVTEVRLTKLIDSVIGALVGKLPGPAFYDMIFPTDPSLRVTKDELRDSQKILIEWVHEKGPLLHERIQERIWVKSTPTQIDSRDSIKAKPPGFPYEIKLHCQIMLPLSGQEPGMLRAIRDTPKDLEALHAERLKRAISDKSPKLLLCKEEGARTILVLESDCIALTGYDLVGAALIGLSEELTDELQVTDEIYFVHTPIDSWLVWPMKCDDRYWSVEDWVGWNWTKFHVDNLIDLTR